MMGNFKLRFLVILLLLLVTVLYAKQCSDKHGGKSSGEKHAKKPACKATTTTKHPCKATTTIKHPCKATTTIKRPCKATTTAKHACRTTTIKHKTTTTKHKTTTTKHKCKTTTTTTHRPTTTTVKKLVCCRANEEPRSCVSSCNARTCSNLNSKRVCNKLCRVGQTCDCRLGYARNDCGKCVKEKHCKKQCKKDQIPYCAGINETPDGCTNSREELTCETFFKDEKPHHSSKLCTLNRCRCIDGYVRNKHNVCVFPLECKYHCKPPTQKSCHDAYEVVVTKFKKSRARTCKKIKYSKSYLKKEKYQKNVCDCIDGYLRNNNGRCVLEDECDENIPSQCSNPCPNEYEVFRCLNPCIERTCEFLGRLAKCTNACIGSCDCIDKYRRDSDGNCVPEINCEKYCTVW